MNKKSRVVKRECMNEGDFHLFLSELGAPLVKTQPHHYPFTAIGIRLPKNKPPKNGWVYATLKYLSEEKNQNG